MKALFGILALVLLFACGSNTVVYPDKPKTNHETFSYKEGDTTYVMQKYFLVMLKKGPNREHSKEEAAEIQKKHNSVGWISMDHSGDYVELAMYGPGSDLLKPFVKNTDLHQLMLQATNVNA